jgi:hypothetical protein
MVRRHFSAVSNYESPRPILRDAASRLLRMRFDALMQCDSS